MKEKSFKILIVASLILSGAGIYRTLLLSSEIKELKNRINNLAVQNENYRVDILSSVDSKLEKYNDVLVNANYNYEDYNFDDENLEIKIKVEALPKIYDPDITQVYLVDTNGQSYPLYYNEAEYAGEITMPVFDQLFIDHIVLDNNETLSSQMLNWEINPQSRVLPQIEMKNSSDIEVKHKNHYEVVFNGKIHGRVFRDYTGDLLDVKDAAFVVEIENHEIDRIPFEIYSSDNVVHLELDDVNRRYKMNQKENLNFYAEIESGDFTIRRWIDRVSMDEKGERIADQNLNDDRYDKNIRVKYKDKVIYDKSHELKKK